MPLEYNAVARTHEFSDLSIKQPQHLWEISLKKRRGNNIFPLTTQNGGRLRINN
jgi:hypothetical protein